MTTIAERVAAGAAFLDEAAPDWLQKVSVFTLDLSDCTYCVLGQLTGDYDDGMKEFGLYPDESAELGFSTVTGYSELTAEWERVITERLAAS